MAAETTSVLFVCLGNICRSPLAEGVFLHLARERGVMQQFDVDSCGTGGWHVGAPADERSAEIALLHEIELTGRARKLDARSDFDRFQLIVPMDQQNEQDLIDEGVPRECVRMLRSFDVALAGARGGKLDVPDPYYGGPEGFSLMYEMIRSACEGMLEELVR